MWRTRDSQKSDEDVVKDLGRCRSQLAGERVKNEQRAGECHFDAHADTADAAGIGAAEENSEGQAETPSLEDADFEMSNPIEETEKDLRECFNCNPEFGINLAPLLVGLCSDRTVIEQDEAWDYEALFQEISEDLARESAEENPTAQGG
ncbi:hypothetical protein BESB_020610 [Besnoitia besnoiti]|uniref:Uncharacterized protein n=1 Tax=Besnoitia besnoiti TaxID=94643 RepID=A0A2A9M9R0_BESBE|nr:hypothetical protein BESB_020610 [Besnoitia besnoiti]PFH32120.1 hypothetical protein BESB_020610 [Besnoitia besnoiti]